MKNQLSASVEFNKECDNFLKIFAATELEMVRVYDESLKASVNVDIAAYDYEGLVELIRRCGIRFSFTNSNNKVARIIKPHFEMTYKHQDSFGTEARKQMKDFDNTMSVLFDLEASDQAFKDLSRVVWVLRSKASTRGDNLRIDFD